MVPSKIELKIDNKDVPSSVIESFILRQTLGNHHRFEIELRRREKLEAAFGGSLEANLKAWLSKTISLKLFPADSSSEDNGDVRFIGVITEINFTSKVESLGNISIAGFSPTIMLDMNNIYHIWCDMNSSAIINQLVTEEDFPNANVSASGGAIHAGLLAYDDTAFKIIKYLASFEGWWAYYDGLSYNIASSLPDEKIELKANYLDSFSVGVDSTCLKDISGTAYEFKQGSWFSSNNPAPNPSSIPLGRAASAADKISKTRACVVPSHNPVSQRDLDHQLESISKKSNARLGNAQGATDRYGIIPGKSLNISWSPRKRATESRGEEGFNGLYLLTRVEHVYKDAKYSCKFNAVARDLAYPYYGKDSFPGHLVERAWVTNVTDPEKNKLGNVRVKFDWKSEDSEGVESPFIRVCQLQAGVEGSKTHGTWVIPEVGDGVLVSIRGRHLENAAVIGSMYDGSRLPQKEMYTDSNTTKAISTKAGNEIIFNDTADKEQVIIKSKDDTCSILMDASKNSENVSIAVKKDGASFVLDGSKGKEKISLASKGSGCQISLDGVKKSISIKSDNSIVLEASEITLKAKSAINLQSQAQIKQKANAMLDLDGGAMLNVKGGIVKIN